MTIRKMLVVLVPLIAAMGAVILGIGQQQYTMACIAVFAALMAAIFTDGLKWFWFNPAMANIGAVVAVGLTFFRTLMGPPSHQLIMVAELLILLQIILLFQRKKLRIYWQICTLSLLQVVVAAALNMHIQFGFLLVAYLFLSILTATLLFLLGEAQSHARYAMEDDGNKKDVDADTIQVRGPTISQDVIEQRMLPWQLFVRTFLFGVLTMLMTFVLFFFMPRFGEKTMATGGREKRIVGFDPQVQLGEVGAALEDPEVVMRVQFTLPDGRPYHVLAEPYLRGAVLTRYAPVRGNWIAATELPFRARPVRDLPANVEAVEQTIVLESPEPMFSVFPVYRSPGEEREIREDRDTQLLSEPEPLNDTNFSDALNYKLLTTAFRNGIQRRITPITNRRGRAWQSMPSLYMLTMFDERFFPTIKSLAQQIVDEIDAEEVGREQICRALEMHFRSGKYAYSLEQTRLVPRGVDPVEFFVAEHKTGHCEYFASALALMLRSQGIPARLVIGFRGGEYNRVGHYLLVRQLHAHAWVEAYLEPEQIDDFTMLEGEPPVGGGWLRLDPTPGLGPTLAERNDTGLFSAFSQVSDFLEVVWRDYVVGLDSTRQREAIYRPLERTGESLRATLLDPEWWRLFLADWAHNLGLTSRERFLQKWWTWSSIPLLLLMVLSGVVGWKAIRWAWKWIRPYLAKRIRWKSKSAWRRDPQLQWYVQLERALGKHIRPRRMDETPREFVLETTRGLESTQLAEELIQGLYQVRFGGQRLAATELSSMESMARTMMQKIKP